MMLLNAWRGDRDDPPGRQQRVGRGNSANVDVWVCTGAGGCVASAYYKPASALVPTKSRQAVLVCRRKFSEAVVFSPLEHLNKTHYWILASRIVES
jgi:hypothetical protein